MKKINFSFIFFIFLLSLTFIYSCRQQPEIPIKIDRLEQSLFAIPIDSIPEYIPRLEQRYGELFDLYSILMFRIFPNHPNYHEELSKFLTDYHIHVACKKVMEVFPDLTDIESGLGKAFYNYRKEFPDRIIPAVSTLITGFGESIIVADTILAIALDNFLGKNEDLYFRLELPNYRRQTMDRKFIVPNSMKEWVSTDFSYNDSIDNVLTNILYEGKVMYALRQLLPETPDSLLFGFTPDQMRWCRNNTKQMWTFLVEKKMLYATDYLTINKLIGLAPFTSLFTTESPGRAVVWLGYRIIESYMKNNKTVTLEALLLDNDYQQILAKARFKP